MARLIRLGSVTLLLASCGDPAPPPQQQVTVPGVLQCGKDTDCKGDRVCDAGHCVSPGAPLTTSGAQVPTHGVDQALQAQATPSSDDPVPVCESGQGRTEVPVWQPSIDERGNLSSAPPQKDGLIVYIRLYDDFSRTACNDEALNSFSLPEDPSDVAQGGLAVNIRGNTQFANGVCYFSGYYMNEMVMGMHQGWIETYYGAVAKKEIVLSGRYCLSESIE